MYTPKNSLRFILNLIATFFAAMILIGCAGNEARQDAEQVARWEAIEDENCRSYFDGCNNCTRDPESGTFACTRKSCEEYGQPMCLDDVDDALAGAAGGPRVEKYRCSGNNRFRVYHGEYIVADTRVALEDSQVMFVDGSTRIAEVMTRQATNSGERYVSGDVTLWTKEDRAVVNKAGAILYANCKSMESN